MQSNFILISVAVFFISLVMALVVTALVKKLALRWHIGEAPDPRKVHKSFMPHMGGLGIFAGWITGMGLALLLLPQLRPTLLHDYGMLLLAGTLIVLLGAWDDLRGLNPGQKFFGQFVIVSLVIFGGLQVRTLHLPGLYPVNLGWLAIPLTYLWMIGVSNAVNLLDGLDGLAGGFSAIAVAFIATIVWHNHNWILFVVALTLLAGILGFLRFNYHPAKIFMGDTGSLFLGLMLAVLSLRAFEDAPGRIHLELAALLLAIPIGDTIIAFFRRLNKGRHPFKPDKDHLHHRLIYLGLSHRQAVHIIYLAAFMYASTALLLELRPALVSALTLIGVLAVSFVGLKRIGYLEARRQKTYYGEAQTFRYTRDIAPLSLSRLLHKALLAGSDILAFNAAFFGAWWMKYESGLLLTGSYIPFRDFWVTPLPLILSLFWLLLYIMNDLYSMRWDISRFDQLLRLARVVLFGGLVLFILTMDPGVMLSQGRVVLLLYIGMLILFAAAGRLLIIQIEKYFAILEYAPHKTLLVGTSEKGRKLLKDISNNPHLLYQFTGYVDRKPQEKLFYGLPFLGTFTDVPEIIRTQGIEEMVIAVPARSRDEILNIVALAENAAVSFKVLPQLYDVISGHKTEEMSGHPLIRLFPDPMRLWQWTIKRLFDMLLAFILIVLLMPFFILAVMGQVLAGITPLFTIDNTVGKFGKRYGMLNLNTYVGNRRPPFGVLLYRTRFYKFPALLNILLGQMSFIGPRPEDEKTAEELRHKVKFYNRRFQVRPGLTGWAQVRFRYDEALKHKREHLKQDLYYLENMSLNFDLRIFIRSVFIFFVGMKNET